jgi:NADH-quinone oxidoreductase subunit N
VCLFSLTGLPPTAGFIGKLNLFLAAWSDSTPVGRHLIGRWLAILLAVNAAISAYYYLRLVALMFLEPAEQADAKPVHVGWAPWLAGIACAVATVAIFIAPQWLWDSIG